MDKTTDVVSGFGHESTGQQFLSHSTYYNLERIASRFNWLPSHAGHLTTLNRGLGTGLSINLPQHPLHDFGDRVLVDDPFLQ